MTRAFPTTWRGADMVVLIVFVGWRIAILAQMLPAIPDGVATSPRPGWYLTTTIVVLFESLAACAAGIRDHRPIGALWTWIELAGVCTLLLASPAVVQPAHRIGSWIGFAPSLALGVLSLSGAALTRTARRSWTQVSVAAIAVVGCYLATTMPGTPPRLLTTVIGNAFAFPISAALVAVVTQYLRRLAADAAAGRQAAADAAELAERQRNQLLLHDSASILRLVAGENTTPDLATVLRRQAAAESARIRTFLGDAPRRAAERTVTLAAAVNDAVDGFGDLPIDLVMDLGGHVALSGDCADAVRGAVRALLHNIRLHAAARSVVIHADTDTAASEWELSIRDDGQGYDMPTTPPGFGLVMQVHRALAEHGVQAVIRSEPGEGTVAVLRGAVAGTPPNAGGRVARAVNPDASTPPGE